MPDPVPLRGVKLRHPPQESLIKMLKDLLESAEKGELQQCAFACVYATDLEAGGSVGEGWSVSNMTTYAMTHAINRLSHKWMESILRSTGD